MGLDLLPQQQVPPTSRQTDTAVGVLTVRDVQARPGMRLGLVSAAVPVGQVPADGESSQ